jgi:hypothetical protein
VPLKSAYFDDFKGGPAILIRGKAADLHACAIMHRYVPTAASFNGLCVVK